MKTILFIGAGRSSSSAIRYILEAAERQDWFLKLGDRDVAMAKSKIGDHPRGEAFEFNALEDDERGKEIEAADFVISMLPARFHMLVARDCIRFKKNVITPSYVTPEMKELHQAAVDADIIIMNEIGVDPGIDHLSAKKVLDEIEEMGGKMQIFESFTGGLLAPESENNPWQYKFTWNPRNVVLAGQGSAAKFIQKGKYKYIPYNKLFRRTELIEINGLGTYEGYANRDSLKYRAIYGLENIPTIYRGTFRRPGFSKAWDVFIQLGVTDDSYILEGSKEMTHRDFINSFLSYNPVDSVEMKLRYYLRIDEDDPIWQKLLWIGIFDDTSLGLTADATPAQILQIILERKWQLEENDKDLIVMWHKFGYTLDGEEREINSCMQYVGQDQIYTAMSDTVGLPVAICSEMIMNGTIKSKGVQLPISKDIYVPVLAKLEEFGIKFVETEVTPKFY